MGNVAILHFTPQLYINFGNKKVSGSMLINCLLSSLTQSKTKHEENLAVVVKLKKKQKKKTPALKTTDIGKILNHYNIVKEERCIAVK